MKRVTIIVENKDNIKQNAYVFNISKTMIVIAVVLSFAAIGISIFCLCTTCPRVHGLDLDYLGVIIGILSLLVTALLGWSVYSVIDWKERLKKVDELKNLQEESISITADEIRRIRCTVYLNEFKIYCNEEDCADRAVYCLLGALNYLCRIVDFKDCDKGNVDIVFSGFVKNLESLETIDSVFVPEITLLVREIEGSERYNFFFKEKFAPYIQNIKNILSQSEK